MAEHVLTLNCTASAYVDKLNPNTNFSTGQLKVGDDHFRYKAAAEFDNTTIPIRKLITNVKLKYYIESISGSGTSYSFSNSVYDYDLDIANLTYSNFTLTSTSGQQIFYSNISGSYYEQETYSTSTKTAVFDGNNTYDYFALSGYGSAHPPQLIVTYIDVPPNQPTNLFPSGSYLGNNNIIRFSWTYNSSVGGTQKSFVLKWSDDGITWTTVTQTTANNYYDMPADTFSAGNVYWKVTTYNEYDEASPESDVQSFYAIGVPETPTISTITTVSAKPTISWTSSGQHIYQINILDVDNNIIYDSGNIASTLDRQHKVASFLADATYTVKLRIKNEYDLWSEWASTNYTLTTTKPSSPSIILTQNKYSITATSSISDNSYLLLYRAELTSDTFICVSKSTTSQIIDYTVESNTQYKYFVRAVSNLETYNDSTIKVICSATFRNAVLSSVSDLSNVFEAKYNLNERPIKSVVLGLQSNSNYFSGRAHAVTEYSEFENETLSIAFFTKSREEYNNIKSIIKSKTTVLYRDARRKLYGNISELPASDHRFGYQINFTIAKNDYSEEMEV